MTMLTVKCLTHKETFKVETINSQCQIMNLKKKHFSGLLTETDFVRRYRYSIAISTTTPQLTLYVN